MDFSYYISFFHDGVVSRVHHAAGEVQLDLASTELLPEENKDSLRLDANGGIEGTLTLQGVTEIRVNGETIHGQLYFGYDHGQILDLEVTGHGILLRVSWRDFPPKPKRSAYSKIEVGAEKILWEDALNGMTVDLTGLWTDTSTEN